MLSTKCPRRLAALLIFTLLSLGLLANSSPASATGINVAGTSGSGLREHSGPSLGASITRSIPAGAAIDIVCQTTGDNVHGSTIWDRLGDGGYVSDWYTTTPVVGGFSPGLPRCDEVAPAQPSSPASGARGNHVVGTGGISLRARSGPGVGYAIVRRISDGDVIAIACQTRGDNVLGSNVWDKLTDGSYVSDYYTDTPVYANYSPGFTVCDGSTPPLAPVQPAVGLREQRAIDWARSQNGSVGYAGWCDRFVANAFGRGSSGYATAAVHLQTLIGRGELHAGDTNAPAGALVFYYAGPSNFNAGHVALSIGNGQAISSEHWEGWQRRGVGVININDTRNFGSYAGWAWANSEWAGR